MARNFGFEAKEDEDKRVEFWTGFIAGGVASAATLFLIIGIIAYNLPDWLLRHTELLFYYWPIRVKRQNWRRTTDLSRRGRLYWIAWYTTIGFKLMASNQNPYSQYSNVVDRFDKLKKSFERLVEDNIKLQDKRAKLINPYEQKLSILSEENKRLKDLLDANVRVIKAELRKEIDQENKTPDEQAWTPGYK